MRAAFYTGTSGLVAFQNSMDVIGNNISNCSTVGYKAQKTAFQQLLASNMNDSTKPVQVGNGVRSVSSGIALGEADYMPTQGDLDLAISGDGWFCVQANGQSEYTRDGSFALSLSGGNAYLVNRDGAYVLDSTGKQVTGAVDSKTNKADIGAMLNNVGVFTFSNPEALTPTSSNSYLSNAYTGTATAAAKGDYTVLKGYLEQSDVSLADEMAALITAQRGYQLSARVVQTADEVEQTINSLRG
ncbi:MAG: flagellar hook-basal body protein [Oscillospiraceae bacterium]